MLRSRLARIGLATAVAGLAVLGVSLYNWTQADPRHRLFDTEHEYEWVRADSSGRAAAEGDDTRDETWQVAAACVKPYFIVATERARAKLKDHGDTAPDEIRASRNRPHQQHENERQDGDAAHAEFDEDYRLHGKYQDWFLAELRLATVLAQWERRLGSLADRSRTLREARLRVMDVRLYISEDAELATAGRDFQHFVFFLLGLGGFPDEAVNAIKAACIEVIPLKLVVTKTSWHTEVGRWPLDQPFTFWPGLALAVVGLLLIPIAGRMTTNR
jgi:hypothetical protein